MYRWCHQSYNNIVTKIIVNIIRNAGTQTKRNKMEAEKWHFKLSYVMSSNIPTNYISPILYKIVQIGKCGIVISPVDAGSI